MINRKKLKLVGPFEGILGLGLPNSSLGRPPPKPKHNVSKKNASNHSEFYSALTAVDESAGYTGQHGFLSQAKVKRFSMCFNDGGSGVLRLDQPKMNSTLGAIGKAHWAVDFHGISV